MFPVSKTEVGEPGCTFCPVSHVWVVCEQVTGVAYDAQTGEVRKLWVVDKVFCAWKTVEAVPVGRELGPVAIQGKFA